MDICTALINGKREEIDMEEHILSGRINENDLKSMRCKYCDAIAQIVHCSTRKWHFRATHEPWCEIVNDGRKHKSRKINENTIIDSVDTIISYTDHAPSTNKPKPPKPNDEENENHPIEHEDHDDIDEVIKYGTRNIHTVGGIFEFIKENGLDADIGGGLTGRDLLLNRRALRDVRRNGMSGIKIAIAKRFSPTTLDYDIDIPEGYICLCDAFSSDLENAIFFLVKLSREDQNILFRKKIIGSKYDETIKDRHKNILILGNWSDYNNNYYEVYITEDLNSRCYKFIDYSEV